MANRVSDRLSAARRKNFVGRVSEQEVFQSLLTEKPLSYHVLHIFGPGGVGKTSLLRQFEDLCEQASARSIYLDGRNVEPAPASFLAALQAGLSLSDTESLSEFFAAQTGRVVILLDTFEILGSLEEWLRSDFIPNLPENVLVVIGGRQQLNPNWRTDPGWQDMVYTIALHNLAPDESRSFMARRNIPEDQHQVVMEFTHGHPLALSLVAEVFAHRPGFQFVPEESPDVIKQLVERFVQKVPGPAHRAALEACSLVRLITEAVLARMLASTEIHDLFEWLRSLSFIESRRGGLFPHDLARDALIADLRWRNPDWYTELHSRARRYYVERLSQTTGSDQQRVLWDFIYLHRDNPTIKPFFEWQASGSILADGLRPSDLPHLIGAVISFEGEQSAKLADHWFHRFPGNAVILRDAQGQPAGFLTWIDLRRIDPAEADLDPSVRQSQSYLNGHAPLRAGEIALLFRFWMACDTYQNVSSIQSLIFVNLVRQYLTTPGLAYTFLPCADPDFWQPGFAYGDLHRLQNADYSIDGHTFGVFGHDWRVRPPLAWLDLLAQREVSAGPQQTSIQTEVEPVLVLSEEEFGSAVREALRAISQPILLQSNPLLRSRFVVKEVAADASERERIDKLSALLLQEAEALRSSPRSEKLFRALDRTYFHPAPTQEIAAELLDLPFSTYRRHLKSGIEMLVSSLWRKEIGR